MKTYLVGGAVRDELLGLPVHERDWVVVGAREQDLLAQGYRRVGRDFPVFLHPDTHEEYALARTERKRGHGYTGFEVHASPEVSLEEDLRRRDLTINAMARDAEGRLIDPYGGQRDLEARLLRHVSPAFVEDPLRVLRVARFAAQLAMLDFRVAPETLELMREIVRQGELEALVPERVWLEMRKALSTPAPARFFEVLRACGALAVLFPELERLFGVPQRADYHPEIDTGVHTLMVLTQAARLSEDLAVRFAALVHDLGKGETPRELWPRHQGHEKRSRRLVAALCERLRVPRYERELALLVAEYHGQVHRALELRPATVLDLLSRIDAFRKPERFEQFLLACTADSLGRRGFENAPFPQADYLREAARRCTRVDTGGLREQGLSGQALAAALRRRRIQLIAALKDERAAPSMAGSEEQPQQHTTED